MTAVTPHNVAGLTRWAQFRAHHRRRMRGFFFLDRRPQVDFGPGGSLVVGRGSIIGRDFTARIEGPVYLGRNAFFDPGCQLVVRYGLQIGDDVLIWEHVTIDDSVSPDRPGGGAIHIGHEVSIGPKATILGGVTIGDRCIIGAHAVVSEDVPDDCVAFGVPARVHRVMPSPSGRKRGRPGKEVPVPR